MKTSIFTTRRFWLRLIAGIICSFLLVAGFFAYKIWAEFQKLELNDPTIWESVIREFEQEDKTHPPVKNAVLFVGSSSIRFWRNLSQNMAPIPVIQRGFGGSKLRDIIHFADRIILPYQPRAIVLFTANDITGRENDKTPEQVLDDFKELAEIISIHLPNCQVYYLPITPTTRRWHLWKKANRANELIKNYISRKKNLHYVNLTQSFLQADGKPNDDLLWWDGLHLNSDGYKIWEKEIKFRLLKEVYASTD